MKRKLIAGSLAVLAVGGGTAGAIAGTTSKDDQRASLADGRHCGGPPRGAGGPIAFSPQTMATAAKALGVDERELFSRLRDGDAKAKAAVRTAATERLAEKLKDGDITRAQHDELLEHLDDAVDHLEDARGFHGPHGPRGFGHP